MIWGVFSRLLLVLLCFFPVPLIVMQYHAALRRSFKTYAGSLKWDVCVFLRNGLMLTSSGTCPNIQAWTRWGFPADTSGSQTFCCITGKRTDWRPVSCFIFVCLFKRLIELQLQPLRSSCSCSELWVTWETEGNPCMTCSLDSLHQSLHLICHVPAVATILCVSPVCVTWCGSYWRSYWFSIMPLQWTLTRPRVIHSADERFDATYHTNVVVVPSGNCSYVPPGRSEGPTHRCPVFTFNVWSLKRE